jgi:hypothetical protein
MTNNMMLKSALLLMMSMGVATAQNHHLAVWFRPYNDTLLNRLAQPKKGNDRTTAVRSLYQEFSQVSSLLGANTIIFRLIDEGQYPGQYGCGVPYNPNLPADINRKPGIAVAEETILNVASHFHLKVIFTIEPSFYHRYVSPNDGSTYGPEKFIDGVINPQSYYGNSNICTDSHCSIDADDLSVMTDSSGKLLGLSNSRIQQTGYANDSRIAGWVFVSEIGLDPVPGMNVSQQEAYLQSYWDFFYNLVHSYGNQYGQAMVYAWGGFGATRYDDFTVSFLYRNIKSLKHFFGSGATQTKPDVYGFEWYMNHFPPGTPHPLTRGRTWVDDAISAYNNIDSNYQHDYPVPTSQLWLAEGAADLTLAQLDGQLDVYYADVLYEALCNNLFAVSVWSSDTYSEETDKEIDFPSGSSGIQGPEALFSVSPQEPAPWIQPYNGGPEGWWNYNYRGTSLCSSKDYPPSASGYNAYYCTLGYNNPSNRVSTATQKFHGGLFTYTGLTETGQRVAEAFQNNGKVLFYAFPGPIHSGTQQIMSLYITDAQYSGQPVQIYAKALPGQAGAQLLCSVILDKTQGTGQCTTGNVVDQEPFYLVHAKSGQFIAQTIVAVRDW